MKDVRTFTARLILITAFAVGIYAVLAFAGSYGVSLLALPLFGMAHADDDTYNGWINRETWNVALILGNDEGTHNYAKEIAENAVYADDDKAELRTGDRLQDYVEQMEPEQHGMVSDLFRCALVRVAWRDVAESYVEEAREVLAEEYRHEAGDIRGEKRQSAPHKFEGEADYAAHYWNVMLDGGGESLRFEPNVTAFEVTPTDRVAFDGLEDVETVYFMETGDGFWAECHEDELNTDELTPKEQREVYADRLR